MSLAPRLSLATRLSDQGARFRALPATSRIALGFLVLIVVIAVIGPWIAPFGENESFVPASAPDGTHLFGTDIGGRDVLTRLLFGSRVSVMIGLGAVALAVVIGAVLGSLAATSRTVVDETVMRVLDVIMAFPGIALAAALLFALSGASQAAFGSTVPVIILAIAIVYSPQLARVVRANVLAQYGEDYVRAERVIGAGRLFILTRHVVRNTAAPILVFATVMVADAIILEASLSFLGAGVQQPAASWGNVMSDGRELVLSGGWWATTFGGVTILLTVLALNILAEGLTDAMVNPRLRRAPKVAGDVRPRTAAAAVAASDTEASALLDAELARLAAAETHRTDRLAPVRADAKPVLTVRDLSIRFPDRYGPTPIVDGVSFTVREGETMALVGESGCGKSITSLAIMGLQPRQAVLSGSITVDGRDLVTNEPREREKRYAGLRGEQIAMIYQDSLSALNPSMLVKDQLTQLTRRGGKRSPRELLELVRLDPDRTLRSYPHELSGGQRQRVVIALALSRDPRLLVADEPTTALDVTVQRQVVELLNDLREQLGFALVFVSHDLALVASLAHRVTVMYAGQVVETAPTSALLRNPRHEYTRGLLGSVLSIEADAPRLHQIRGTVPSPRDFARGDRFAERSVRPDADPDQPLTLVEVPGEPGHRWASHLTTTTQDGDLLTEGRR